MGVEERDRRFGCSPERGKPASIAVRWRLLEELVEALRLREHARIYALVDIDTLAGE